MGKVDYAAKRFMLENRYFADAVNYALFNGQNRIDPRRLKPMDSEQIAAVDYPHASKHLIKRVRDVVKKAVIRTDGQVRYMILGVENQRQVDRLMVLRCALYDIMTYWFQVEERMGRRRSECASASTDGEFLSFYDTRNKLIPVFTLVIYYGPGRWDGPRTLRDLLVDIPDELVRKLPYYPFHLIDPSRMGRRHFNKFRTNFGEVLKVVKAANKPAALKKLIAEDEHYKEMDPKAVDLINACTGARIEYTEQERKVDMRNAFDMIREEDTARGMAKGLK